MIFSALSEFFILPFFPLKYSAASTYTQNPAYVKQYNFCGARITPRTTAPEQKTAAVFMSNFLFILLYGCCTAL